MLLDSPRLSIHDRAEWQRLARYDSALSGTPRMARLIAHAEDAIRAFLADGDAYVSVSWGKDSVVVADLAARIDPTARVEWVRAARVETPETAEVRDAFLALHPHVTYIEHEGRFRVPLRGEPGFSPDAHQDLLGEHLHGRRISGIRAEESRTRSRSAKRHGTATDRSCRPILQWRIDDVFAYLARHDLPIHPAYAMSLGGTIDRKDLRVHALRTCPPFITAHDIATRRWERWEDAYYPDIVS